MLTKVIVVVMSIQFWPAVAQQEAVAEKPLPLCALFRPPFPSVQGLVAIRGTTGSGLNALRDPDCPGLFELQGERWPQGVWDVAREHEEATAKWRRDGEISFAEFQRRYGELLKRGRIRAVFRGKLHYRERYEGKRNAQGGGFVGNGFGPFGIFPVEIDVHGVSEIEVLR